MTIAILNRLLCLAIIYKLNSLKNQIVLQIYADHPMCFFQRAPIGSLHMEIRGPGYSASKMGCLYIPWALYSKLG